MSDPDDREDCSVPTFDELYTEHRERAYSSAVGFAEFLDETALEAEQAYLHRLLDVANCAPCAEQKLRDYLSDQIDQWAQVKADAAQSNSRPVSVPRADLSTRDLMEMPFLGPKS